MYYYFHNQPQAGVSFLFQMAHQYPAQHCGLGLAWLICLAEIFGRACGLHPLWSNQWDQLNSDRPHNEAAAIPSQGRHKQDVLSDCQDMASANPSPPTRPSSLLLSVASVSSLYLCPASLCALLRGHDLFLKGLHVCVRLLFKQSVAHCMNKMDKMLKDWLQSLRCSLGALHCSIWNNQCHRAVPPMGRLLLRVAMQQQKSHTDVTDEVLIQAHTSRRVWC